MGVFLVFYAYGTGALLIIFLNLITYLIYWYFERNRAAALMSIWTFFTMFSVAVYNYLIGYSGYSIKTALGIHFAKTCIIAWNYYDAGIMDDPTLSKWMTTRERYYAEPHKKQLSFSKWINFYYFIGSTITPMHEYRDFEEFINYKGNVTQMPLFGNIIPACRRFLEMFICIGVFVIINSKIKPEYMFTP